MKQNLLDVLVFPDEEYVDKHRWLARGQIAGKRQLTSRYRCEGRAVSETLPKGVACSMPTGRETQNVREQTRFVFSAA